MRASVTMHIDDLLPMRVVDLPPVGDTRQVKFGDSCLAGFFTAADAHAIAEAFRQLGNELAVLEGSAPSSGWCVVPEEAYVAAHGDTAGEET